ncbi:alpha-amylase family glycosyl hydrolase [Plebeiibacterium marinum]|uniref:Alpha-amylase family glycosyl hydrolase n=1 Tax=Plebeiibacterium marinum TaxID=2992111 RepID=A0AAE3MDJ9_9BACT|nr:alpha-amylase family glycosyl hydrolase [Plebeiobacterium marinum]MCW3805901.1 alpha-amylase family glycosyl hydrolase [Plebeiobacterium marinum]
MQKIVIYQIFTRLFGNNNTSKIKNGTIEQNGCGKMNSFTPKALHEIKNMGITHVWYTGIIEHATTTDYSSLGISKDYPEVIKGKAGSPYAIKDYYDVCPDLATNVTERMNEFEGLVSRSHDAGLKVIIDFVPNHLARHYISDNKPQGINDFGENDDTSVNFSASNNFYYLPDETFDGPITPKNADRLIEKPAKVTGNDCLSSKPGINDWYETIKLNYGINIFDGSKHFDPIPDTWQKMYDVLLFWADKKIDGFRCDMAEMVPVEFWHWVIPKIKEKYPKVIFIAEVYNPDLYRQYITYGGFDFLYDKVGMYDTLKDIIQGHKQPNAITKAWDVLNGIHQHMLFFLENHDEQRIASPYFAGNPHKAIPALIISGLMYSNPLMIYFGQELGEPGMEEEGFSGKDGRTTIFDYWSIDLIEKWINNGSFDNAMLPEDNADLQKWYKKFLNILHDYEEIKEGKFYDLMWANEDNPYFDSSKLYAFLRYHEGNILLVVVNFSPEKIKCRIKIPAHAFFTIGVESNKFFKGVDILTQKNKVSFPQEVAITNGLGVKVAPYSGRVYELK